MIRFGKPSSYLVAGIPFSSELYHHGIKGQKWGVRRFQNPDRSLTEAGKIRYNKGLNQSIDFSNIKDKKQKAAAEKKLLMMNDLAVNYEDYTEKEWKQQKALMDKAFYLRKADKDVRKYVEQQDALWEERRKRKDFRIDKIGTKEFDEFWDKHQKLELEICGAILRKIGFEDTQEARILLDSWQIWR